MNTAEIKKLTLETLFNHIREYNAKHGNSYNDVKKPLTAAIVFSNDTEAWDRHDYSLEDRTYVFDNYQKYWYGECIGNSLFAQCPSEFGLTRLDWYIGEWKVEYCYLIYEEA